MASNPIVDRGGAFCAVAFNMALPAGQLHSNIAEARGFATGEQISNVSLGFAEEWRVYGRVGMACVDADSQRSCLRHLFRARAAVLLLAGLRRALAGRHEPVPSQRPT